MRWTFRPIDNWHGKRTQRHQSSQFKASYSDTLELLQREVDILGATTAVIQIDLTEDEIRNDGLPRANSRPRSPAVAISFESRHGPLRFATDKFGHWHENLRAIALGMEALRKIDRYGISQAAEQYTGWRAIGSGTPMPAAQMSVEDAARFLVETATGREATANDIEIAIGDDRYRKTLYRRAAKQHHPDAGGDHDLFARLELAKSIIDKYGSA